MTRHTPPAYQTTEKDHNQTCQKHDFLDEQQPRSAGLREPLQGSNATQLVPFAPFLQDNAHTEPDDLIAALVLEPLDYLEALRFLGFEHNTSLSILRYWITVKLEAPAGGPYNLLGIALAAIAELAEPDVRARHGGVVDCGNSGPRSDWPLVFAQVLNHETLAAIQRVGVYFAPDFTKAKWLVYHMILRKWDRLVGRR